LDAIFDEVSGIRCDRKAPVFAAKGVILMELFPEGFNAGSSTVAAEHQSGQGRESEYRVPDSVFWWS
jgi:hypothetical protein